MKSTPIPRRTPTRTARAALLAGLALLAPACAVEMGKVHVKDGKEYGTVSGTFRNKWWNFYERGVSYSDGGYYDDAVADFKAALEQREEDTRRARTYGLHFIQYFPRRELGIAYFKQGRLEEALTELERSQRAAESAKTKYYINEVNRALLKQSNADTQPPTLSLEGEPGTVYTREAKWEVKGKAGDDKFVETVTVGQERIFFELAQPGVEFNQAVSLQPGENLIPVVAADLVGNETKLERRIIFDPAAPQIVIASPLEGTVTRKGSIKVSGSVADESPIAIEVEGERVKFDPRTGDFEATVPLKEGENRVRFSGVDKAGNKSEGSITVYFDPNFTAPDGSDGSKGAWYYNPAPRIRTAMVNGEEMLVAGLFDQSKQFFNRLTDRDPPEVSLKDFIENETVYVEDYYLQGSIKDANLLKSVTLNGQPLTRKTGTGLIFAKVLPLKEGENVFTLEAEDEKGNKVTRTLKVQKKTAKVYSLEMRVTASVLPFVVRGASRDVSEVAFDNLVSALVNQKRFNLVDREKLDTLLKEQQFQVSDLIDPDTQSEIGELAGSQMIMAGVATEKPQSLEVYLRMVNPADSTVIIVEEDIYGENKSLSSVNYLMKGLAFKLARAYPIIEGKVVRKTDDGLEISFGSRQGLKPEMDLYIYRDNPEGDLSNPVEIGWIPSDGQIGAATAMIDRSAIDFFKYINAGDRIITR